MRREPGERRESQREGLDDGESFHEENEPVLKLFMTFLHQPLQVGPRKGTGVFSLLLVRESGSGYCTNPSYSFLLGKYENK